MADIKPSNIDISLAKKLVPTAPEAERSVLGCLILDKDSILKIADFIEATDFYHDHHRFIYEAVLDLFHKDRKSVV